MKLPKLLGMISLTAVLCTGCINPGKNTPENLLSQMPIYDEEKKDIRDEVNRVLGSGSLVLPSNSTQIGMINEVDLNGDGKNEIIFFHKKETLRYENKVGFTILDDSNYESSDISYSENGSKIKFANFYDLDRDHIKEIILTIEDSNGITLTICKYNNGTIKPIVSKINFDYANKNEFIKLGVLINDINNDNILDVIVYNYDYKTKKMNIYVADLKNDEIDIIGSYTFEDVRNFTDINVVVGNISANQKALFLSIPYVDKDSYVTEIVYFEDDKLISAFENSNTEILNSYYIPFEDINNDGVTNIPIRDDNITSDILNSGSAKNSATVNWKKYNEKKGKNADLLFISQIYYNYENNFKFLIPNNLVGKLFINEESNETSKMIYFCYYDFSREEPKDLFTLTISPKSIVDDSQSINKTSNNVLETDKNMLYISNINEKELKKLDLNLEIIADYFSKINN